MSTFKRIIPTFFIGSTSCEEERAKVASAMVDLNSEIEPDGNHIRFKTYQHLQNNQDQYNEFIDNQAELIIVVIDGILNEESRKEIRRANIGMLHNNHPKSILTFISDDTNFETINGSFVHGVCSIVGQNSDYWIKYKDSTDLAQKVKDAVRKYVQKTATPTMKERINTIKEKNTYKLKWILTLILLPILAALCCWFFEQKIPSRPILLVTGGGSAANYVNAKFPNVHIMESRYGYFVHMASGDTWRLLVEEITSPISSQEKRYIPTSVSASRYKEEDLLETITEKKSFSNKGAVIEILLGYDTLAVMIQNSECLKRKISQNSLNMHQITSDELRTILVELQDSIHVFTTSPQSGTKASYARSLYSPTFNLYNYNVFRFEEDSELTHITKDGVPFVVFGSKYYHVKKLADPNLKTNVLTLTLIDQDSHLPIIKPIYFYCMAYKKGGSDELEIPIQTLRFLKHLDVVGLDKKIKDGRVNRISEHKIILDFYTDLVDW